MTSQRSVVTGSYGSRSRPFLNLYLDILGIQMLENKRKENVKRLNSKSIQRTYNCKLEERKPYASFRSRQVMILTELNARSYSRHCLLKTRFRTKLSPLSLRQDDIWHNHVSSYSEILTAMSYRP